jgi:ABC-type transport system involved in multi-copper enzyme maturation permease subunit
MRNVWTIARREYSRFFSSPVAYVVSLAILLVLGIMFALTILVYM